MSTTSKLRELVVHNWGTSSIGTLSIILAFLGNMTQADIQTYIDWFNNVMKQDNKLMRIGLIAAGIAGLLSKDPGTPTPPAPLPSKEPR